MILKLLKWTANRSHNLQTQVRLAALYGLLSCFGFHGSVAIVMKLGKQVQRKGKVKTNGN